MTKSQAKIAAGKVNVSDLVGQDIRGMKAITVRPEHRNQFVEGVPVDTLIRAERKKVNGEYWLYLYFKRGCGYSGWREGGMFEPEIEVVN